jgi:hypothetical protein
MRRCLTKTALFGIPFVLLVCGIGTRMVAQEEVRPALTEFTPNADVPELVAREHLDPRNLLLQLGAQIHETELDCSHFVQFLYQQVGLDYGYAPSRILYEGMEGFKRVRHPKPGDLIVWRGHVGIVVDPEEKTFLSALRSGVKTSSYESHYWKLRGHPRFLRYMGMPDSTPVWTARKTFPSRVGNNE